MYTDFTWFLRGFMCILSGFAQILLTTYSAVSRSMIFSSNQNLSNPRPSCTAIVICLQFYLVFNSNCNIIIFMLTNCTKIKPLCEIEFLNCKVFFLHLLYFFLYTILFFLLKKELVSTAIVVFADYTYSNG